jgi:protein-tyrosine phosphatase
MAQGVMESTLFEHGFDAIVDSAGTAAYHSGEAPDRRGQAEMRRHGIDISRQRARQFRVSDFDEFDYIFAMDKSNYQNILALASNDEERNKVKLFMNVVEPATDTDVPDPYYGGDSGFTHVYHMLVEASEAFVKQL